MVAQAVGSEEAAERESERVSLGVAEATNVSDGHHHKRAACHRAARRPHRAETPTRSR